MLLHFLTALVLIAAPGAFGACTTAKTNFDPSAFSGTWYLVEVPSFAAQLTVPIKCVHHVFSSESDGKIPVRIHAYNISASQYSEREGTIRRADSSSTDAKFLLERQGSNTEEPYNIVATDYNNYAVFCSRITRGDNTLDVWWVSSRAWTLDSNYKEEAQKVLPSGNFTTIDNADCSHEH